eukprot:3226368-Pyramimonas_sp.AAC.1
MAIVTSPTPGRANQTQEARRCTTVGKGASAHPTCVLKVSEITNSPCKHPPPCLFKPSASGGGCKKGRARRGHAPRPGCAEKAVATIARNVVNVANVGSTGETSLVSEHEAGLAVPRVYSHDGPIRHRKRGYILVMDQLDAGSAGIFS